MPTPRLPLKQCRNAACGKLIPWRVGYWRVLYCDAVCSKVGRPKVPTAVRQVNGRKGGRLRAVQARPSVVARWMALAGTMTPWAAFRAGVRWQQQRMRERRAAELAAAERAGYARGWSDAIGEAADDDMRGVA